MEGGDMERPRRNERREREGTDKRWRHCGDVRNGQRR